MIYSKDIEPMCLYCEKGSKGPLEHIICSARGIVTYDFSCKKYVYDPLKRIPPKKLRLSKDMVNMSDFEL